MRRDAGLMTAQLYVARETEAPAQWESVVGAADGVGIVELGMRMRVG